MRIWNFTGGGRESHLGRQAARNELLRRGLLVGQHLHPPANIPTFSERIERFMERMHWLCRMDGGFYRDTRSPFTAADITSVTLATTDKALYPVGNFPVLGSNYFGFLGKKISIEAFGRMTTAATPGNGTCDVYWGTGADANGTIIQSSGALALAASQTNLSWHLKLLVTCRGFGASGALLCTGRFSYNAGLYGTFNAAAMTAELVPPSAPAQVTVDLTAANIVSVQYKRSGSTVETMQIHDLAVEALN